MCETENERKIFSNDLLGLDALEEGLAGRGRLGLGPEDGERVLGGARLKPNGSGGNF